MLYGRCHFVQKHKFDTLTAIKWPQELLKLCQSSLEY